MVNLIYKQFYEIILILISLNIYEIDYIKKYGSSIYRRGVILGVIFIFF